MVAGKHVTDAKSHLGREIKVVLEAGMIRIFQVWESLFLAQRAGKHVTGAQRYRSWEIYIVLDAGEMWVVQNVVVMRYVPMARKTCQWLWAGEYSIDAVWLKHI